MTEQELWRIADSAARRYTVPGMTWEDLRQEARLAAWLAFELHEPERGPLRAHVWCSANNRLKTLLSDSRRAKRRLLDETQRVFLREEGEVDITQAAVAVDGDPAQRVPQLLRIKGAGAAIARLLNVRQQYLFYGALNGRSLAEMAAELGLAEHSAATMLSTARRVLREAAR